MSALLAADWQPVVYALAASIPGLAAAIIAALSRRDMKTPSGPPIGQQVEQANAVSAVTLAYTSQILKRNGETPPTLDDALRIAAEEAPGLVAPHEPPQGGAG